MALSDQDMICDVWEHNLEAEMARIRVVIDKFPFVSMVRSGFLVARLSSFLFLIRVRNTTLLYLSDIVYSAASIQVHSKKYVAKKTTPSDRKTGSHKRPVLRQVLGDKIVLSATSQACALDACTTSILGRRGHQMLRI